MSEAQLIWGKAAERTYNHKGQLAPQQRERILQISIFDPWLRLLVGSFFIMFALTQQWTSWQFWVPIAMALFPLGSALNGILARRRLKHARVEHIEGQLEDVRKQRATAISATLHRDKLYMLLLDDLQDRELPKSNQAYGFWVVFGVIRPGIVVAIEEAQASPTA